MIPVRAVLFAAAALAGSHSSVPQAELGPSASVVTPAAVTMALNAQIERFAPLSADPERLAQAVDAQLFPAGAAPAERIAGQYLLGVLGSPKALPVVRRVIEKSGAPASAAISESLAAFAAPYQDKAKRQAFLETLYKLPGQLDVQAGQFDVDDVKRRFDTLFDNGRSRPARAGLSVAAYYGASREKQPEAWTLQPSGEGEILVRFKRRQRAEVGGLPKDLPVTEETIAAVLKRRGLRLVGSRDGVYRAAAEDGRSPALAAEQLSKEDAVLMAAPARLEVPPADRIFVRFKGLVGQNAAADLLRRRGLRIVDVQEGVDDVFTVVPARGKSAEQAAADLTREDGVLLAVPAEMQVPAGKQLSVKFKPRESARVGGVLQDFVVNDDAIVKVLRAHGLRLIAVEPDGYRVAVTGNKSAAEAAEELARDGAVLSADPR